MERWCVPAHRRLVWYEWQGEAVVFNTDSGETHYLNIVSAEALRVLESSPADRAELTAHFTELMPDTAPDDLSRSMHDLLETFAVMGLIDPCRDG